MSERAGALIGRTLNGKWTLERLLGEGGMAWVFAATHRNGNRAAIKVLKPDSTEDPDLRRRFLREGFVANKIGHPGAVLIFDDDIDEQGNVYLVMELLDGASLDGLRLAAEEERLEPSVVLAAVDQLLDVLAAAHDRGIVHRDVKPANAFVLSDGRVKVLDFGIARLPAIDAGGEATSSETLLGSFAYCSPEQARGAWNEVDPRSDIWSVGATLFRLLTGEHVHPATGFAERLVKAVSEPARAIGSVVTELHPAVAAVVDRALAFEPARRFPGARSMQHALRKARAELTDAEATEELAGLVARLGGLAKEQDATTAPERVQSVVTAAASPRAGKPVLSLPRREALERLAALGVTGSDVFLIDTIPLLEMIWADDRVQSEELRLLEGFLRLHVKNVNELAGREVLTLEGAREFVARFLTERPSMELLRELRALLAQTTAIDGEPVSLARRRAIMDFCLDIGAACVAEYPHGDHERFCEAEKQAFGQIVEAFRD